MQVEKTANGWTCLTEKSDANANTGKVIDALLKGDGETAKVFQGTDQSGGPMTHAIIKNYRF